MPNSVTRESCAFCNSRSIEQVLDLGEVALAGAFVKPEQFSDEQHFPLRVFFCNDCFALQLLDIPDTKVLFENYFYFSSAIQSLREHFLDYASEVVSRFLEPAKATVVEIGCNDGILLRPLAEHGVKKLIGVDPASNVVSTIADKRINIVNSFFNSNVARTIRAEHGAANLVVANNVYAHIPGINDVTNGIAELLDDDGVFAFEVHYLGSVIAGLQYDMIYHEHLYYYSLSALDNHFARHGLVIFDLKKIPIHGGSIRYYVCKKSSQRAASITTRVTQLRQEEIDRGYRRIETFRHFAKIIEVRKNSLMRFLERARAEGRRVAGYGASGRANTIMQYCGITSEHLDYMIDDAPAKWGYFTPGSHIEIRSRDALVEHKPDYLLLLAWGYFNEIAEKCGSYLNDGGHLLTPLPEVRLISHVTLNTPV